MSDLLGNYILNKDRRFRCGVSTFALSAGASIEVAQVDTEHSKVLIRFRDGGIDWYPISVLDDFFRVADAMLKAREQEPAT